MKREIARRERAEAELAQEREKRNACPIGLDATPDLCSSGCCSVCAANLRVECVTLTERNAKLVEALKPFARAWKESDGDGYFMRNFPASDFRRALAALQEATAVQPAPALPDTSP